MCGDFASGGLVDKVSLRGSNDCMREREHTKEFLHNRLSNAATSTRDKSVTAFYAKKGHCSVEVWVGCTGLFWPPHGFRIQAQAIRGCKWYFICYNELIIICDGKYLGLGSTD